MSLIPIEKKEWRFVLLIAILIPLLTLIPVIYGYASSPAGQQFMGLTFSVADQNTYFDYMSQASHGNFLFRNSYTSEPMPSLLIRPLYFVLGVISALIPSIIVYHGARILLGILFLILAYGFISLFTNDIFRRRLTFILIAIGSGIGYMTHAINALFHTNFLSIDAWVVEAIPFMSMNGPPHFILSYILLLGIMGLFYLGIRDHRTTFIVYAGLLGLLLGFEHIYDVVPVYLVLGAFVIILCIAERRMNWKHIKSLLTFYAISIPSSLYYVYVFGFNTSYKSWTAQNILLSPHISSYLLGFGFILLLALVEFIITLLNPKKALNDPLHTLIMVWFLLTFILLYAPVSFQSRFVEGLYIPMAILAGAGFMRIMKWIRLSKKGMITAALILCVLIIPSNILFFKNLLSPQTGAGSYYTAPAYLTASTYDALVWLHDHTNPNSVILSDENTGNYIPRISGNKVYVGHWAQTQNFPMKRANMVQACQTASIPADLGINYVVWPCGQSSQANPSYPVAYQNSQITIYQVS